MGTDLKLIRDPDVRDQLARRDLTKSVGMLNMLKFRRQALYDDNHAETPCSGEEAYARYASFVAPILEPMGARVLLTGALWMIERPDEWDRVFVVQYKQAADLLSLITNPEYNKIVHHRTAALADSRLLMMDFDGTGLR